MSYHISHQTLSRLKSVVILVAGDVMLDEYIFGVVDRISPEAPVPVLLWQNSMRRLGGSGNVVQNLVSLGAKPIILSRLGKDERGNWLINKLKSIKVDIDGLLLDESFSTISKTRIISGSNHLLRLDREIKSHSPKSWLSKISSMLKYKLKNCQAIILSDYGKGFLTDENIELIIDCGKRHRMPVVVDPKGVNFRRYRGANYITPNEYEAGLASGVKISDTRTACKAGKIILEDGNFEGVVITRGDNGAVLVTKDVEQQLSVGRVNVADVTGAGDTFISMLTISLANGFDVTEAIRLANLAASITVKHLGASTTSIEELELAVKSSNQAVKYVSIEDLLTTVGNLRIEKVTIAMVVGAFDLWHSGQLKSLESAKRHSDIVIL